MKIDDALDKVPVQLHGGGLGTLDGQRVLRLSRQSSIRPRRTTTGLGSESFQAVRFHIFGSPPAE